MNTTTTPTLIPSSPSCITSFRTSRVALAALSTIAVAGLASTASAQWTVTNLNPDGATTSISYSAAGSQQVGSATVGGASRASVWSGTAASWIDLTPSTATSSFAEGAGGSQQVGGATISGVGRASLWSGTAASWIDLNPAGSTSSIARATNGSQQVGVARVGGVTRASRWSGAAATWVDLHPTGATNSEARAISGSQQGGVATISGLDRASLWSGTAASRIDLNPAGSAGSSGSAVYGMGGSQQVGYVGSVSGGVEHASVWSGTAASWVDLNPATAQASFAFATTGSLQVGYAYFPSDFTTRASLWSGTAASWVDLSIFLPSQYSDSTATGISADGVNTYISGYAFNSITLRNEALLWTRPNPPAFTNLGVLPGGFGSVGYALSADGLVVTGSSTSTAGERAFRWTAGGGMVSLGVLTNYAASSLGQAVNSDGSVVAGLSSANDFSSRAFRWTAATGMVALGDANSPPSQSHALSADGSVVVGESHFAGLNEVRAFRWTSAGMQNLGLLPGVDPNTSFSTAWGESGDGAVIAGSTTPINVQLDRAFRWTAASGMQDLGVLPGANASNAFAVSADGLAIAGTSGYVLNNGTGAYSYVHATRWTAAAGIQDLGALGINASNPGFAQAWAISGDGASVVGSSTVGGLDHAFLWTPSRGMVDLNTYLPTLGINLTGWTLSVAKGISANGAAIAGYGTFNGVPRAWLVSGLPRCTLACPADFNCSGSLSVQDIFDFLAAWFAQDPRADFNGVNAITPQDILDFLAAWFAGC